MNFVTFTVELNADDRPFGIYVPRIGYCRRTKHQFSDPKTLAGISLFLLNHSSLFFGFLNIRNDFIGYLQLAVQEHYRNNPVIDISSCLYHLTSLVCIYIIDVLQCSSTIFATASA